MMIRQEIKKLTEKAVKELYKQEVEALVEQPENADFGDYSTNIAMLLKKNPQEIASAIKSDILEKIEIKNGFINFSIPKEYLQNQVGEILKEKASFGGLRIGHGQKVNVEFISANPTGPLTLGNGRGGFCGDVLANVMENAGYKVTREYYINDTGEQIRKLGHSVLGDAEAVYKGDYIKKIQSEVRVTSSEVKITDPTVKITDSKIELTDRRIEQQGRAAADIILEEMIKPTVKKMGIDFDVWFSEKTLHEKEEVKKVLGFLKKEDLAYEKEGALWFKSTQFGDDKDRVLVKADGETTYLASDIAYLKDKFKRGFNKLIFFWGADHYGYINRVKAAAVALGYKKEQVDIIIMQLVAIMWHGEELRMSKREGVYRTVDELIDGLGLDVTRFFFLMRGPDSHLTIDLNLASEKTEKNPVYYIQYAYARICSIIAKIKNPKSQNSNFKTLNHPSELNLIKQLIILPEIVEDTAKDYQVQRLPRYATDLAIAFHQFYRDCRVINENGSANNPRLALVLATKIILENTLKLMGISAPEKM